VEEVVRRWIVAGCLGGEDFPEGEDIEDGEFVCPEKEAADCACLSGNEGYRLCEDGGWGECRCPHHSW